MKMDRVLLLVLQTVALALSSTAQFGGNSPPTLLVSRTIQIPDTEAVGSVVTRVTASDGDGDVLTFGLERSHFFSNVEIPFDIHPTSGVITTNSSVLTRGGESFLVKVTVFDGHVQASVEVYIKILQTSITTPSGEATHPPVPPGFRPANVPIGVPSAVLFPHQLANLPTGRTPAHRNRPVKVELPIKQADNASMQSKPRPVTPTSTPTSTSPPPSVPTATAPPPAAPDGIGAAYTVIPVAVVSSVVVTLAVVAFLFRRRICKYRNKINKEDLRKESLGSVVSEDSIAMQHWRGPRASNNRYEGWDAQDPITQVPPPPVQSDRDAPKFGDKWEFPRHHLKVFNILGEGCFGQVWRCEAIDIDGKNGPSIVAVKTLKENATEKERTDLVQELDVMKMLDPHPNVVRLLGCCTEKEPLFVIMEFIAMGKLQSFLRNSRAERNYGETHGQSDTLTSGDLTGFAYQCARGMDYLSSKGIIHRDLAARNILVDEERVCKVADFGFARDIIDSHVYERKSEGRLPIRWMAPESLYDNVFSVKSDVWSFGVLLWEIVTLGSTPYPGLGAADVMRKVREGYRLEKPEHCRRELYNIMFYCWDKDPKERPSFPEIVTLLESLLLTETEYIELERFPDHSYYNMVSLSGEKL